MGGNVFDGAPQLRQERPDDVLVDRSDHAMKARRELLPVGVPADLVQSIGHGVDVQGIGGKGEDANIGITEDLELRDAVDPFNQGSSRIHNYAREARVTFGAEEIQDGPGRRNRPSGTATCERRRAVEAAGPVADGEELVPASIAVAAEDDG